MPKIKIDRFDNGPIRCSDGYVRGGLRERQTITEDRQIPLTQREKDDCFDMYRTVETGRPGPAKRKMKGKELPQLWFVASIIAVFGAFCIFMDSIFVTELGVTMKLASFEILLSPSESSAVLPSCAIYMSIVPLVFLIIFGLFAFLKEDAFKKASMILIAVPIFVIVVLIYWSSQISNYSASYTYYLSPGYAVLGEIGCSVGLIIVTVCHLVMEFISQRRTSFRRR